MLLCELEGFSFLNTQHREVGDEGRDDEAGPMRTLRAIDNHARKINRELLADSPTDNIDYRPRRDSGKCLADRPPS